MTYLPRISIAVVCYNYGHFLADAIESALAQDYTGELEIVIYDDGSQDSTREVAGRYVGDRRRPNDPPVRFVTASHRGAVAAFNAAVRETTGDAYLILSADDRLDPSYVRKTAAALRKTVAFVYSGYHFFGAEDMLKDAPDFDSLAVRCVGMVHGSALVRRAAFDAVGGFTEQMEVGSEDWEFYLKLLSRGLSGVCIHEPLLHYRKTYFSSRSKIAVAKQMEITRKMAELHPNLYPKAIVETALDVAQLLELGDIGEQPARKLFIPSLQVSVIIPTRERTDLLTRCLELLPAGIGDVNCELLVIDNGNGDAAKLAVEHGGTGFLPERPLSFAEANNRGARLAKGEWLLLLNDDVEPWPMFLPRMLEAAEAVGADIVGARLVYPNGTIQHNGVEFTVERRPYHVDKGKQLGFETEKGTRPVSAVTFACVLIRRAAWLQLDGLDESYVNLYEDVDFCLRAQEQHMKIVLAYEAVCVHHHSATPREPGEVEAGIQHYIEQWTKRENFPVFVRSVRAG